MRSIAVLRNVGTNRETQPATPQSAPRASTKLRWIQTSALTLLVLSGLVSYIDRAPLSIGSPLIRDDLHLSVADMGVLLSAFLWAYAIAQLPIGVLVDTLGPRRLLAIRRLRHHRIHYRPQPNHHRR